MRTKTSKFMRLSLAVIAVLCLMAGITLMGNVNATTVKADASPLGDTKYNVSTNGEHMLLVTPITDVTDVYEVGYEFTGENTPTLEKHATNKYYTSISAGLETWTAKSLFGGDYTTTTPMIIWEVTRDTAKTYSYKAYYKKGTRVGETLYAKDSDEPQYNAVTTTPLFFTVTIDEDGGSAVSDFYVPYGTAASLLNGVETTKVGYHYNSWEYYTGSAWADLNLAEATVTADVTVRPKWTINIYNLSIASNNTDYGTVDVSSIEDVTHGTAVSTSENTITIGETTITATPAAETEDYSYSFDSWSGVEDSIMGNLTITAIFVKHDKFTTWNVPAGWGGTTTIADTSGYAEGTLLDVTMKVKQSGVQAGWNSWLLLKTTGGTTNFTHNTDIVGKNRVDLSTLTGWTEVNGTAVAGSDGVLQLQLGTINENGACNVYYKDIVISALSETATRWDMPYGWGGATTLADTDYPEGTFVQVSLKVKSRNVSYSNDVGLLINGNVWLTKFRDGLNADTYSLRNLSGWTEFTVETQTKANGIIELTFGNTAAEEGTMGTVFYKDVVVEDLGITRVTIGGEYSWGKWFTLAETDIANGTAVTVTLQLKTTGMNTGNGTFLNYNNGSGTSRLIDPAGWDRELASNKLTDWTELTFDTVVEDGAVKLQWAITGPDSAYVEPNQIFDFKDIVITVK